MMTERKPAPHRRSPAERRERHKKPRLPEETTDTPWRLFIAVPLPPVVRDQVAAIIEHLQTTDVPVRWIDPDNGHLTLHFIGEIEPELAELLRMALGVAVTGHQAFDLRTADPGAFPSLRRPRVLWLGLWGPTHRLEVLYNDLGDFLDDFGLEIEDAPFHPHITLGRIRSGEGVKVGQLPDQVRDAFADLADRELARHDRPVPFPVTEVHLMRSHLGKDGPRYEVLAIYPLAPAED
jgi:2'-5' RNA ligase